MKKIIAEWDLELWVDCPHCRGHFELMKTDQWASGLFEAFENICSTENDLDIQVKCEDCHKEFVITGTQY